MSKLSKTIGQLPVGLIATTLGLCTLSNAYFAIDLPIIRTIVMGFGLVVWGLAVVKGVFCHQVFLKEYSQVVPSSLYATFPMLTAVLSSFFFGFNEILGTFLWYFAVVLHMIHLLVFTYRNVFQNFQKATFLPTWFVTYIGLLVPVVVGSHIGHPLLVQGITYYGFAATLILLPLMLTTKVPETMALTNNIYFAPLSLCLISYLNVWREPNIVIVVFLSGCLLVALGILGGKMLFFVKRAFHPTFASLTFPCAIATIAFYRIGQFFYLREALTAAELFVSLFGVMVFFATGILLYVAYRFVDGFLLNVVENLTPLEFEGKKEEAE
ncbi:TDT family transporter [Enterococcus casseliflavus]|uniref:TDT family transporter n=1 Tax=Enterococcus casseliflavus TaxID=37734 RepID=UPI00191958BC|nr:TDT family transporter [Enterococcus casseliflavus]QQU15589.1 TDT family transporter [Enterococcus casseliflavus]